LPRGAAAIPVAREDPAGAQRSAQIGTQIAQSHAQLVFLGDSITDGWTSVGGAVWERFYAGRAPINMGVGGDRTEHVLWRIERQDFPRLGARVIVLMIGTNNMYASTPAEIAAGVDAVVQALHARVPAAAVVLLAIFPRGELEADPLRQRVAETNRLLRSLRLPRNAVYLDIGKSFLEADGRISPETMPDALHLSAQGYERWACALEPTLQKVLGGESPAAARGCSSQ
jgi:lysophospholipase L1-like esterase